MDPELEQFNTLWADKEHRDAAKAYAIQYCADHTDLAQRYGLLTRDELVVLLEFARDTQHDDAKRTEIDIWLLANFEPQQIGGPINLNLPLAGV